MREIVHLQAGQCGNQIGAKVSWILPLVYTGILSETKVFLSDFRGIWDTSSGGRADNRPLTSPSLSLKTGPKKTRKVTVGNRQ